MTAEEMIKAAGIDGPYEAWCFGTMADELASLVLRGIKTATASAYTLYELDEEPIPKAGDISVILDSSDKAVCIIRDTKVYTVPYREVSESHAYMEGEGDRTLDAWRQVHQEFFTGEMEAYGLEFTEDMLVLCEEFEVIYPTNADSKEEA